MKEKLNVLLNFWKSKIGKVSVIVCTAFLLLLSISLLLNISNSAQLANAQSESDTLLTENEEINQELETSNSEREGLQQELDNVTQEFEAYKEKMQPYEEMEEAEAENREHKAEVEKEEREEAEAEKKAEEEEKRKKAEEEAQKEKEQEEEEKRKQGYDTGITFEDLARNPDQFEGEKVKFNGKIIQVMEGDTYSQMRLAVNDNYDRVIYIEVAKELMADGRILEDDYITIMGTSVGLLDYESAIGSQITVPAVVVDDFEMQ